MAAPTISTDVPLTEPRQRVLSSRISNVLAAPYSDLELRDALTILDQQGFKNTVESRRQLRLDCQEEVIKQNGQILSDFGQVAAELRQVEQVLNKLTTTSTTLRKRINGANRATGPLREEASTLFKQKQEVQTKQAVLQGFQAHFLMTEAEIASLTSPSEPVDSIFFDALTKLKRVHADTGLLLSSQNDRLGLSILDQSSKTLNSAFQKLFRWAQKEFHTLDLENPRLSASMRRALRVLAERPALFASSLDHFANAREEFLSASFHTALTGDGNESIIGKPIEFQAHDPLRYISDMLAWAHSATVGEREALEVLFIGEGEELAHSIREGLTNDLWTRNVDGEEDIEHEPFDPRKSLDELVSRDIAGVVSNAKTRIEQVIHGQEDAVVAYRIANLLLFYNRTFTKVLGPSSQVVSVLESLEALAHTQFRNIVGDLVAQIETDVLPTDPSVPTFLTEALTMLTALLKSYDTSLSSTTSNAPISSQTLDSALSRPSSSASSPISSRSPSPEHKKTQFTHPLESLLRTALSPFLSAALSLAGRLPLPVSAILSLNSLSATHSTLTSSFSSSSSSPCAPVLPALSSLAALHAERLSNHVLAFMLASSGLGPLFSSVLSISPDDHERLLSLPLLKNERGQLGEAARRLDAWLPGAMMGAAEETAGLLAVGVVTGEEVRARAAERFVDGFVGVVERIESVDTWKIEQYNQKRKGKEDEEEDDDDEEEEIEKLRDVFPRTAQEIAVLLS